MSCVVVPHVPPDGKVDPKLLKDIKISPELQEMLDKMKAKKGRFVSYIIEKSGIIYVR